MLFILKYSLPTCINIKTFKYREYLYKISQMYLNKYNLLKLPTSN